MARFPLSGKNKRGAVAVGFYALTLFVSYYFDVIVSTFGTGMGRRIRGQTKRN
jgi:hypothetical protein